MVCFGIAEVQIASHRIALHCGDSRDVPPTGGALSILPGQWRAMICHAMPCHEVLCML